jgi:acetyl esterase
VDVDGLRKKAGGLVMKGFFEGVSRAAALHPASDPARYGIEVLEDLRYRPGRAPEYALDIWRPRGVARCPVVLYVHGGAFRILSKDTHWVMALAYARAGYMVVNVNYRLAPRHPFPAAVQDACAAYGWVVENASRFGGDLDLGFVLAGESAGANLVSGLTIASCYARDEPWAREVFETARVPDAVVAACGILEVSGSARFGARKKLSRFIEERIVQVEEAYLGGEAPHVPGERDLADPLAFFERGEAPERPLPPFFLPVGTADPILDDTRRMAGALRAMGVPAQDAYYPGGVHAFHAFVWQDEARRCWEDTYAFLEEHVGSFRR